MNRSITGALCIMVLAGGARAYDSKEWRFAGERYGITFYFKGNKLCESAANASLRLKLVNSRAREVKISFRVNDLHWDKRLEHVLRADAEDSSLVLRPGRPSCRPYINDIFFEQDAPLAKGPPMAIPAAAPPVEPEPRDERPDDAGTMQEETVAPKTNGAAGSESVGETAEGLEPPAPDSVSPGGDGVTGAGNPADTAAGRSRVRLPSW